jgi:hypothetical protein
MQRVPNITQLSLFRILLRIFIYSGSMVSKNDPKTNGSDAPMLRCSDAGWCRLMLEAMNKFVKEEEDRGNAEVSKSGRCQDWMLYDASMRRLYVRFQEINYGT